MLLNNSDILTSVGQFITNLFRDFANGLLFFGGPLDIVVAILDVLATSLVVYYVLRILRDSRAWQLLKGLILIISFAVICSLFGLTTVGFLMNNTLSVLAIAFVVIFQPELRRALEAVGRSSFNVLSSAISQDETGRSPGSVHNQIESIVRACEKMAETHTGALIILERQTKLSELIEQENVVLLDSAISATLLQQIFYKGSPLHDGAVLIRDGRISAARVHVPLSDNYHLRKDYGTRHRAAIGASEMGDAIAVVISEERGCIGLTVDGRLYTLDNGDALRTILHKQLSPARMGVSLSNLGSIFRAVNRRQNPKVRAPGVPAAVSAPKPQKSTKPQPTGRPPSSSSKRKRVLLMAFSLAIAIVLWLYVQVTINPVDSKTFTVPLQYQGIQTVVSSGLQLERQDQDILVTLQGRKKTISDLKTDDIIAFLDCSKIASAGTFKLEVQIETSGYMYLRRSYISPSNITVNVKKAAGS